MSCFKLVQAAAFAVAILSLSASKIEAQTFPNFGGPQEASPTLKTTCAPAATNLDGIAYIAYNLDQGGDYELAVADGNGTGFQSYIFDTDAANTGSTTCSPAIVVFNGIFTRLT
jgi:hypothetical protein